jgi:hypothetical protein
MVASMAPCMARERDRHGMPTAHGSSVGGRRPAHGAQPSPTLLRAMRVAVPVMGSDRDDSARAPHRHQSSPRAWKKWWNRGARHGWVGTWEIDVCAALSGGLAPRLSVRPSFAVPLPPAQGHRHYFIRFVSHETAAYTPTGPDRTGPGHHQRSIEYSTYYYHSAGE